MLSNKILVQIVQNETRILLPTSNYPTVPCILSCAMYTIPTEPSIQPKEVDLEILVGRMSVEVKITVTTLIVALPLPLPLVVATGEKSRTQNLSPFDPLLNAVLGHLGWEVSTRIHQRHSVGQCFEHCCRRWHCCRGYCCSPM